MKIGIYGGTFNPPHWGHLTSAAQAMDALGLDRTIFVPAAEPPHKTLPHHTASAGQRLEMMKIAADAAAAEWKRPDCFSVSDVELCRNGKSYTADTLRVLCETYPDDELWLLMGSDMLLTLHQWYRPEAICKLARLGAFVRAEGDNVEEMGRQAAYLRAHCGADVRIVPLEKVTEVSSTRIRALLEGENCWGMLPEPVLGYILRNRLYGTNADLKRLTNRELEACSLSMVYAKRHAHIKGVAETARRLAIRWGPGWEGPDAPGQGADFADLAWKAGILHDCTKYLSLEEHLAICEKYGLAIDEMERESAKLLHSKTGAALARHIYGMPEAVYNAIDCHTTGKPEMTLLDKIIYLADYMEPNRDFDGVEELRRLCDENLDEALLLGLRMSVEDLRERGVPLHPQTKDALDWALKNRK